MLDHPSINIFFSVRCLTVMRCCGVVNSFSIKPPKKLLLNQRTSRRSHAVPLSRWAIMAARWHPTSLTALPVEVQIEIAGHLATTLERPMDDLCSLWAMCSSMRRISGDPIVDQRVVVDRCRRGARSSSDHVNYFALLARLTQVKNPEACKPYSWKTTAPIHASTISPTPPMASTMWWPIRLPYSFIATMVVPVMTTLQDGT